MQFIWKNMVGVALPYRLSMNSQRCHAVPSNKTRQSFLHPPSRHQQRTMMVTSISSKYFCNTARQKEQPTPAVCMGSPPATSLIWGRWSLETGYSNDSVKGKFLLEKNENEVAQSEQMHLKCADFLRQESVPLLPVARVTVT